MSNRKENTKGFLASTVKELSLANSEKNLEFGSSYINIRPTAPQAAMLEIIRRIKGKNPTAVMQNDISEALAEFLRKSEGFMPIIAKAVAAGCGNDNDGALGILKEEKVFRTKDLTLWNKLMSFTEEKCKEEGTEKEQ